MGQKVKTLSDGSFLEIGQGRFDSWYVYVTEPGGTRTPPRDTDYFRHLQELAARYGAEKVYGDFVAVYDLAGNTVESSALDEITAIASSYGKDALSVDKTLSVLYLAMIAKENKEHAPLGKRMKRLGVYKLLLEGQCVWEAANFMRGMKFPELKAMCEKYGF